MFAAFLLSDAFRRAVGGVLDDSGLGPHEISWRPVLERANFRLRHYDVNGAGPPVLIVPAPIKRPFIFDLLPEVSVVRRLTQAGFSVYLSEWREEQPDADLEASVGSLRTALEKIAADQGRAPIVIGHSLGGTLAAIVGALDPRRLEKLVLIEAPLRFGEKTGALSPIAALARTWSVDVSGEPSPGSVLDIGSVALAPDEFVIERWNDLWASLPDPEALSIHVRVIRWTLEEFAPPARLLRDVVRLLYTGDCFARNGLSVLDSTAHSDALAAIPVAAIVDHSSRLVPSSSVLEPLTNPAVFAYSPEIGVALQHVGPLVGRRAHREIWPRLIDWMRRPPASAPT